MPKRATTKKGTPTPDSLVISAVKITSGPDTPTYYVNYMGIAHTVFDFTLSAVRIPPQLSEEQLEVVKQGQPLPLEAAIQLIVPPMLIDGLINALVDQKKRHEETVAKVRANEQQQQHAPKSLSVQ